MNMYNSNILCLFKKFRYKIPGGKLDEPNLMNKMSPPKCPPTYHIGCFKGIFVQKVFKANLSFSEKSDYL